MHSGKRRRYPWSKVIRRMIRLKNHQRRPGMRIYKSETRR